MTRSIKNLIGAILISISLYFLITEVWPARAIIESIKTRVEEKTALIASRKEILEKIIQIKQERDEKFSEFQRLALVLPSKEGYPELITAIESIFSQGGVVLPEISLGRDKGEGQLGYISLEISSDATYQQLINLLTYMETNIRIFDINKISLVISKENQPAQLESGNPLLTFTFGGRFYFLKDQSGDGQGGNASGGGN